MGELMAGILETLGRALGATFRKGKWVFSTAVGTSDDALRDEHEAGRDLAQQVIQSRPLDPHPDIARFLNEVGDRLVSRVRDKRRRFSFRTLGGPECNAFALPGGYVFVTRPLLEMCAFATNEVAFILAHEMAHVLHGHAMDRMRTAWLMTAARFAVPVRGLVGMAVWSQFSDLVGKAYSRDQELEADLLGVQLLHSAGFDPAGARELLTRLQSTTTPLGGVAEYFSTHPPFPERVAQIQKYIDSTLPPAPAVS
jgi:predicted Zn-dependent protease